MPQESLPLLRSTINSSLSRDRSQQHPSSIGITRLLATQGNYGSDWGRRHGIKTEKAKIFTQVLRRIRRRIQHPPTGIRRLTNSTLTASHDDLVTQTQVSMLQPGKPMASATEAESAELMEPDEPLR